MLNETIDCRSALGLRDTIGQCSASVILSASYDEIMKNPPVENAVRLQNMLNEQRTSSYIKAVIAMAGTYDMIQRDVSAVISYEGTVDLDICGKHVLNMSMLNNTSDTLHMAGTR
jgi:hypothetical protein